ncbi:MAG: hypothetical protein RR255_00385 [Bacilli bacterium]
MGNGNRIICIIGKSCSGKDTLMQCILESNDEMYHNIYPVISCTTRPMRKGEVDGREYYFVSDEEFKLMIKYNRMLEYRTYNTLINDVPSTWYYGLNKYSNGIDLERHSSVVIMDIDGCKDLQDYYGKENVYTILLNAPLEIRLERCKVRGDYDKTEFDRRAIDDEIAFSKDNLTKIKIDKLKIT